MPRIHNYREELRRLKTWEPYLRKNSGLPGPRGDLELAQAVAAEATPSQIRSLLAVANAQAPENTPGVFLFFCGVLGLGRLAASGQHRHIQELRRYASDRRWRAREAVAMALQAVGDADIGLLLATAADWSRGNWLEKRAAAAALAEPRLLVDAGVVERVLAIFDEIMAEISASAGNRAEDFRALRQAMGYCWSVAIAASPSGGKAAFENWVGHPHADINWIVRENLKKNRLVKMDSAWVARVLARNS